MQTVEGYLLTSSKRVGIIAANYTGYVEQMFSCLESGDIAVPLRGMDDPRIQSAQVSSVIDPSAISFRTQGSWMERRFIPMNSSAIALLSFTSGTEGEPKGVALTHSNLTDVILRLNTLMQVDSNIREYIGVPVYHSFGFGRCRAVATARGRFFIPENGFNPAEIATMLKRREINAISAVPSLWRILLANQDLIGNDGNRVKWIEIGSQYMNRSEKEALKALFPNARIVQHYGLTEASRTTLLAIHETEGDLLESVGQATGDVAIKITEEGCIAIRGKHVASNYLIKGKDVDLVDHQGWFVTKDLGAIENGYLYYKGRADDVINCGGIKVHPEAVEAKVYAQVGYNNGLAICRKPDPIRGQGFLVAVTPEMRMSKQRVREAVLQATQEMGVNAGNAIAVVEVEHLPKTPSGKIQRNQLAEWYADQHLDEAEESLESVEPVFGTPLENIFCKVLNLRQVHPHDTFISLGGDSLSYVQLAMELEQYFGYLPQSWENISLQALEQRVPQQRKIATIESSILLRALAITGVVTNHAELLPTELIGGGSFLLLAIAGANFARFQGGSLLRGRLIQPVFSLLRNLLIPYLVIAAAFQFHKHEFESSVLLLFSNFVDPGITSIFPVWFIDLLVQCIGLFALLFALQPVRRWANRSPWGFGLAIAALGVATHLLVPFVWDTSHLFNRVPHMMMWMFALGWGIHFAQSRVEKITTTWVALLLVFLTREAIPEGYWVLAGGMIILWQEYIPIPKTLKNPIQIISGAAYYIYLTHMIFIHIIKNTLGLANPLLETVAAIVGGVILWFMPQIVKQLTLSTANRIEQS
jgi:acyl-CoA synthetase (AMP-forming)/AMP-acid ligase II